MMNKIYIRILLDVDRGELVAGDLLDVGTVIDAFECKTDALTQPFPRHLHINEDSRIIEDAGCQPRIKCIRYARPCFISITEKNFTPAQTAPEDNQ